MARSECLELKLKKDFEQSFDTEVTRLARRLSLSLRPMIMRDLPEAFDVNGKLKGVAKTSFIDRDRIKIEIEIDPDMTVTMKRFKNTIAFTVHEKGDKQVWEMGMPSKTQNKQNVYDILCAANQKFEEGGFTTFRWKEGCAPGSGQVAGVPVRGVTTPPESSYDTRGKSRGDLKMASAMEARRELGF